MKKTFWLLFAFLAFSVTLFGAPVSALSVWKDAYEAYDRGSALLESGNYKAAQEEFAKARELYLQVKKSRPDWNQKLIDQRVAACDTELARTKNLLSDSATSSTKNTETHTSDEAAVYQKRLTEALAELEATKKSLLQHRKTAEEMENLMREYRSLQSRYELLEAKNRDLTAKQGSEISLDELADLKVSYAENASRLANAEKRLEDLSKELADLTVANGQLTFDHANLKMADKERENELIKLREERNSLVASENRRLKEIQKLKSQLEDMEKELTAERKTRREIAAKSKNSESALQQDNAKLREELLEKTTLSNHALRQEKELRDRISELTRENESLGVSLQVFSNTLKQLEEAMLLQRDDFEKQMAKNRHDNAEFEATKNNRDQLASELKVWMEKALIAEKRVETLSLGGKTLDGNLLEENNKLTQLINQLQTEKVALESVVANAKAMQEKFASLENSHNKLQNDLAAANRQSISLEQLTKENAALKQEIAALKSAPTTPVVSTKNSTGQEPLQDASSENAGGASGFLSGAAVEAELEGNIEVAKWYYRELSMLEEGNQVWPIRLAACLLAQKHDDEIATILNNSGDAPLAKLILGLSAIRGGDYSRAQTHLSGEILPIPKDWPALKNAALEIINAKNVKLPEMLAKKLDKITNQQ